MSLSMEKIEHLGIAVTSLSDSAPLFEKLLGSPMYKTEEVGSEGVLTGFFQLGQSKVELLQATTADSPIARFIEKRGVGIHHIAFAVGDIVAERQRLISEGFEPIGEVRPGADNKLVCFFHPRSASGLLVELCQERS